MRSFDDAKALIAYARDVQLDALREPYEAASRSQEIPTSLLIQTKHLVDSLRSALDYTTYGLWVTRLGPPPVNKNIYYPYATQSQNERILRSKILDRKNGIPEYAALRPDVIEAIVTFQHFASERFSWVPRFMDVSNSRKHRSLGDQLPLFVFGFEIIVGQHSHVVAGRSLKVPAGRSLTIGPVTIAPGQYDYATIKAMIPRGGMRLLRSTHVVFADDRSEAVFPFLTRATAGVQEIVETLILMAD